MNLWRQVMNYILKLLIIKDINKKWIQIVKTMKDMAVPAAAQIQSKKHQNPQVPGQDPDLQMTVQILINKNSIKGFLLVKILRI